MKWDGVPEWIKGVRERDLSVGVCLGKVIWGRLSA